MRVKCGWMIGLGLALCTSAMARPADAGASDPAARSKALLAFQHDLVSVLAPQADAMPLLSAALLARPLSGQPKYNTFHSLISRAAKASDASPAVDWTQLADCDTTAETCPNAEALSALTAAAGDNAAVWLLKLGVDTRNDDTAAARADLSHAADARLYDDYTGSSLKALADTVGMLPPPAATYDPASAAGAYGVQVVLAYGLAATLPQPQPGMQAAAKMCAAGKDDAALKAQCLKLAHVLEWGSSPLARSLGLHLRHVLSDDPAEQEAAAQARTNLVWQVQQFAQLSAHASDDRALAQHLLALARHGGTEMSLMLAALRDAGIPTDAPATPTAPATP